MKKELKLAGIVTLYNPTDKDISNIDTYLDDIDVLYVIDNTEGKDNKDRIPKSSKIKYFFKNENKGVGYALNKGAELLSLGKGVDPEEALPLYVRNEVTWKKVSEQ